MLSHAGRNQFSVNRLLKVSTSINVEVVFGMPESQQIVAISVPSGSTVADALEASKIGTIFPDADIDHLPTGIWGRPVERDQELANGDRVEIYRELELEPMESRRLRALGRVPDPGEPR